MRRTEIIKRINEKLNELCDKNTQWVIEVLKNVKLSKNKEYKNIKNPVPSPEIIKKLINKINEKKEEFEISKEIFSLTLKFWNDEYIDNLTLRCIHILNFYNQQNFTTLNKVLNLVLEIVEEVPIWIPEEHSLDLANQLWLLYTRVQKDEKIKVMKPYCITVFSIPQPGNHLNNVVGQIASYDLSNLEEMLEFISKYKEDKEWWKEIEKRIIIQTVQNIYNNPVEFNLERFKFLYRRYRNLINNDSIKNILLKVITQIADSIFIKWKPQLVEIAIKEENLREFIISKLKYVVGDSNFRCTLKRRIEALNTLLETVYKLNDNNLNIQIGEWLLKFAEIQHLQQIATEYIKKSKEFLGNRKFKISISSKVSELCKSKVQTVNTKYNVLNIYLNFQDDWNNEALLFFSEMLVSAIQTGDIFINMAYNLLNRKLKIHKKKKQDLIDAIESLTAQSPQQKEKWEPILKNLKK